MNYTFVHTEIFKYEIFGITADGGIWRVWFDGREPLMQLLFGSENEYQPVIRLLRAKRDLYQ